MVALAVVGMYLNANGALPVACPLWPVLLAGRPGRRYEACMPPDDAFATEHAHHVYVLISVKANLRACLCFSSVTGPDQMFAVDVQHAN